MKISRKKNKNRIKIIALISLIALVIGSALLLPHKIAGVIALGAFVVMGIYAFFTDTRTNFYKSAPSVYHPAYQDLSGNVYHSDSNDD